MKISNSKKELARIISENGGWRNGYGFSAQDGDDCAVWFYDNAPVRGSGAWWVTSGSGLEHCGIKDVAKLPNWHQTILSRDEYFHLYPSQDAKAEFCESVMRSIPEPEAKPTIEQLASDYRDAKDYADRKQKEADAAKAEAETKLAELVAAGKAVGLVLSVAGPEPELVITDWRDLLPGDEVEYVEGSQEWSIGLVGVVQRTDDDNGGNMNVRLLFGDRGTGWPKKWRFIRRP